MNAQRGGEKKSPTTLSTILNVSAIVILPSKDSVYLKHDLHIWKSTLLIKLWHSKDSSTDVLKWIR